jgi:hypothetical protein
MESGFSGLNREEQTRMENDFLKMKLMLQHGAEFKSTGEELHLPPEVENAFLHNIVEFERQFAEARQTTIFEKIGRPGFKPVSEIDDEHIDKSWKDLLKCLNKHGLDLQVCSPHVSSRELYRFATEEFFQQEIDDVVVPGMTAVFIYDEFHPDPLFESKNLAERFFKDLFATLPLGDYFFCFHEEGVEINGIFYQDPEKAKKNFNEFKLNFSEIGMKYLDIQKLMQLPASCVSIKGIYSAYAILEDGSETVFEGEFDLIAAPVYCRTWHLQKVKLDGIRFPE